jgi:hypothetical protein
MMLKRLNKAIIVVLIYSLLFLTLSLPEIKASSANTAPILLTGKIVNINNIVTVDIEKTVATNKLALGVSLGNDWRYWINSLELENQAKNLSIVRIHDLFLLSSSGKPCYAWNESNKSGTYDWTEFDKLYDSIISIGAQPLIALGHYTYSTPSYAVVPQGMAIDPNTDLPYAESYAAYCSDIVRHLNETGRQLKYIEIWNEPESYFLEPPGSGSLNTTKLNYFIELHNEVFSAIRKIDPSILIGTDIGWFRTVLPTFLEGVVGVDFLAFHKYDSWTTIPPDSRSDETLLKNAGEIGGNSLYLSINEIRQITLAKLGMELPIFCTETNLNSQYIPSADPRIHQILGAVWYAEELRIFALQGIKYSCFFSYASLDSGQGMIDETNPQNKWYPYLVSNLISNNLRTNDPIYFSSSSNESNMSVLAWKHNEEYKILLIGKSDKDIVTKIILIGVNQNFELLLSRIDNSARQITNEIRNISQSDLFELNGYTVMLLSIRSPKIV